MVVWMVMTTLLEWFQVLSQLEAVLQQMVSQSQERLAHRHVLWYRVRRQPIRDLYLLLWQRCSVLGRQLVRGLERAGVPRTSLQVLDVPAGTAENRPQW